MAVYIVDTNFFIQAHLATYPLDVAIGFWVKIKDLAISGKLISIDKVRDEIYVNDDELREWCESNLPLTFFKNTEDTLPKYEEIIKWAYSKSNQYSPKALTDFSSATIADAWLVAYGYTHNLPIVTNEVSRPDSKGVIKIPDACMPFSVRTLKPIDMFRELGERF